MMQRHVGIVRSRGRSATRRSSSSADLRARAASVKCGGNIQFNPGWHLALDLTNMLDISEAVARAALERQESRGAHTREDFPDANAEWGKVNLIVRQTAAGIEVAPRAAAADAGRSGSSRERQSETWPTKRRCASSAATAKAARWSTTPCPSRRAWSCSTPCTRCRPCTRRTWPCAGTARRASAARAAPR